jgi:hypothetical protein
VGDLNEVEERVKERDRGHLIEATTVNHSSRQTSSQCLRSPFPWQDSLISHRRLREKIPALIESLSDQRFTHCRPDCIHEMVAKKCSTEANSVWTPLQPLEVKHHGSRVLLAHRQ